MKNMITDIKLRITRWLMKDERIRSEISGLVVSSYGDAINKMKNGCYAEKRKLEKQRSEMGRLLYQMNEKLGDVEDPRRINAIRSKIADTREEQESVFRDIRFQEGRMKAYSDMANVLGVS